MTAAFCVVSMSLTRDSVSRGIVIGLSIPPFICLSRHMLQQYLMNGSSSLDETVREYSLAPADDRILLCQALKSVF